MALTSEDLQAIGGLIDQKLEPIDRRLDIVATKQDLENFATKQDLENFATKQDLENFATKQDVKEIVRANNSIHATLFKVELASTAEKVIKVMKAGFQEMVNHIRPMDETIEDHGKRIEHLEEHTGVTKHN